MEQRFLQTNTLTAATETQADMDSNAAAFGTLKFIDMYATHGHATVMIIHPQHRETLTRETPTNA